MTYEQETSANFWADDWSEFEASDDVPGMDPDEDTGDCDISNW